MKMQQNQTKNEVSSMKRAIVVNYTNSYEQRAQLVREDLEKNG